MITLHIEPHQVRVSCDPIEKPQVYILIDQVTSARPDNWQFMIKKKPGWDGYIHLFQKTKSVFPIGLVDTVNKALVDAGYQVQFTYSQPIQETLQKQSQADSKRPITLHGVVLRDYQQKAVETLTDTLRGIAQIATNGGKTEIIAGVITQVEGPYLIIVPTVELLHQTADRLAHRTGLNVSKIGDSTVDVEGPIYVATIQTLHSRFKTELIQSILTSIHTMFTDECHHLSSPTMFDIVMSIPAIRRYGLSGTPLRKDALADLKLIAATGDILLTISNEELIDMGYSAQPFIAIIPIVGNKAYQTMKYTQAYADAIVNNPQRNTIIAGIASSESVDQIVLCIVREIQHGVNILNAIQRLAPKVPVRFVHGSSNRSERDRLIGDMREGIPGVYIVSTIFDEGVDVPDVNTLILAGGGKSDIKGLQRIGRGLRKKTGKDNIIKVYDFYDDLQKDLVKHSKQRIKLYHEQNFDVQMKLAFWNDGQFVMLPYAGNQEV